MKGMHEKSQVTVYYCWPRDLASSGSLRLEFRDRLSNRKGRKYMAIHKVIEVLSQSDKSWEDAAARAVRDAAKTVKGIRSIYVRNFQADVKKNKIVQYRINAKVTFEVAD
jgi:hypothetical protein